MVKCCNSSSVKPLFEFVNSPTGILIDRAPTPHSPYCKLNGRAPNKG